jgi:hypothetical protein
MQVTVFWDVAPCSLVAFCLILEIFAAFIIKAMSKNIKQQPHCFEKVYAKKKYFTHSSLVAHTILAFKRKNGIYPALDFLSPEIKCLKP